MAPSQNGFARKAPRNSGTPGYIIVGESIRMEWVKGMVTFVIQDLDGYDPEDMITSVTIRVTVVKNLR